MKFLQKVLQTGLFMLPAVLFSACETVVEMPIPVHVPKLAIRFMLGNVTPDSLEYAHFPQYQAYVNHSQSLFSTEPLEGINNATLTVTNAEDKVVETYKQDFTSHVGVQGNGYYQPVTNFTATPGQKYTFTVSAPGYETVTSSLTMPDLVSGLQGTFNKLEEHVGGPVGKEVIGQVNITLPDNGAQNNYYLIYGVLLDKGKANARDYFRPLEEDEDLGIGTDFKDIRFSEMGYSNSQPFDDKAFNGTTLHISRRVSLLIGDAAKPPKHLRVYLHSITEDTYRFLKSLNGYYENNGNPFAESSRVIGNIENGYGYFGGYTSTFIDIELP